MGKCDPRIDDYLQNAADFARPILAHLRGVIHDGADVDETIKWGMPYFERNGLVCGIAGFKRHCALVFHRGAELTGRKAGTTGAMGQFGRIETLSDLPANAEIKALVATAVRLNVERPGRPRKGR